MPETPFQKIRPHPIHQHQDKRDSGMLRRPKATPYAELAVTSNFTFLTGASHPEEFVWQAAELGHIAASIADTNTLAGIVRAHVAAKECGIPLAVGCRLRFLAPDEPDVIVYPTCRPAYARLCRLLTHGKRKAPKGECHLTIDDLIEHSEGLLAIVAPAEESDEALASVLRRLRPVFDDDRLSLAASMRLQGDDAQRLRRLIDIAHRAAVPIVAINDVHYHTPDRRPLQDVLTCIRHGCTIEQAGFRLAPNAERFLKEPDDMERLFKDAPGAVSRSAQIAARAAAFSLDELRYEYPVEPCPEGMTPTAYLRERTWAGAAKRYPEGVPDKVRQSIEHELALIAELRYEPYFLTCYDIVTFARSKGILCQGRGGAANSAVCYCLGVTEVDPAEHSLLFARFVSRARGEPPDIDIDFEHERREEVIQRIYEKYGRDRAALTAEVISYRGRSAVREVGKAMGLSLDCVDALAKSLDRWGEAASEERVREVGLDPHDPTLRRVIALTSQIIGFPRHLSQHVGGFVITRAPLCDLVPIENAAMEDRTVIEWDKDDIDAMNMLKVDCLGLGMLTCIRKTFEFLEEQGDSISIAHVMDEEEDDDAVYEMIQRADTIGVFQIESRAQMSMLPRLKPREFYDLVVEVAIVRPGPIQGGMVHPYLRRRAGREPRTCPPGIEHILGRTFGVPIFQEQAMQLAIDAAGFTPDEADGLRRAMASWRRKGDQMTRYGEKLIQGMLANGYEHEFALRCFEQIKGFSEYGFPESHAASFAILAYVSSWLKRHHPAAFAAALINSQPMGFYRPAQIIRDAQEHGVQVRPIDVNCSGWNCSLEEIDATNILQTNDAPSTWGARGPAIRLGMRLVKGLKEIEAHKIATTAARNGPFTTVESLWRSSGVSAKTLRRLAQADAFGSMNLDRQRALWQIKPLNDASAPLFESIDATESAGLDDLPPIPAPRRVLQDYGAVGLSLKAHPMSFIRDHLDERRVTPACDIRDEQRCPRGAPRSVAGVVLSRQRPGTASGTVFITLEDETGLINLILWRDIFERYRRVARHSAAMLAHGAIEREGEVVHLLVKRLECLDDRLHGLPSTSRDFH